MIELDERDIRAIADSRFFRRLRWRIAMGSLLWATLGVTISTWVWLPFLIPWVIITLAIFGYGVWIQRRGEQALLSEWRNDE